MRKGWKLFLLLVSAVAIDASALTVTVTAKGSMQAPMTVMASARRVDEDAPQKDLQLSTASPTQVDLGEGSWEITTSSTAFWTAPLHAMTSHAVTLELWPRGSISGTLGSHTPPTGQLLLNFSPTDPSAEGPVGSSVCAIANREWNCELPSAGELDLRFGLTGFATEYRWRVKVDREKPVAVGVLDFMPGSSISGRVELRGKDSRLLKDAEISLTATGADTANGKRNRHIAKPDARGFFQIPGLAPGEYRIHAKAKDLVSDTRAVQIIQNTNALLKQPLLIAQPKRVSVRITPPLDMHQDPWQVMLIMIKDEGRADVLARSLASAKGEWSQERLIPGRYRLKIQRQNGSNWGSEDFTLASEDGDHAIDVLLTSERVTGTITLGDRPIAAEIHFGGENGPGLEADEHGRFEGLIPPTDDEKLTLLITSETPDIKRTLSMKGERSSDGELSFDIVLPDTTILGRVIHEDGSPEAHAMVTINSFEHAQSFAQMFVRDDGTFQFSGFEPGVYRLQADSSKKSSSMTEVEVRGDGPASTDLVLRTEEEVRGRVVMKGMPIGGATVIAWPRGVETSIIPDTTTDDAGRFVLRLPPGTQIYDAAVFSPGFYVTIGRVMRDPKMNLRVDVGQDGGSLTVDTPVDDNLRLRHDGGDFALPWIVMQAGGKDVIENGRRHLTIPALEAGQYSICGQQLGCKSVYVPQFATASVKLDE